MLFIQLSLVRGTKKSHRELDRNYKGTGNHCGISSDQEIGTGYTTTMRAVTHGDQLPAQGSFSLLIILIELPVTFICFVKEMHWGSEERGRHSNACYIVLT